MKLTRYTNQNARKFFFFENACFIYTEKLSGQNFLAILTLSLPRVINVKFPLQPHQKYNIAQYRELDFPWLEVERMCSSNLGGKGLRCYSPGCVSTAKCPAGYSRYGTSCFKYHTSRATWDEAVIACAKENATLASIRNGKEETFVRKLEEAVSGDETWIGKTTERLHCSWSGLSAKGPQK